MPVSCAKASLPTIASLRRSFRPAIVETVRLSGQGRSALMSVIGP
jgi:hypothetical protein